MSQHHLPDILVGVTDHLDPEESAMIQAQYSRSYGPVMERLPATEAEHQALKEKLGKFYVGYGHKSVGQLGSTSIYFEGVSQLAAKAIEDTKLFNGQESSTRYIDFSNQPMVHFGNLHIERIQEAYRQIYIDALPLVKAQIEADYPFLELDWGPEPDRTPEQHEAEIKRRMTVYANTIKAATFDICRGILPAGCTTNVVFTGTFDLINDHFGQMLHHPSGEMQYLAEFALAGLADKYKFATPGATQLAKTWDYVTAEYFYPSFGAGHEGQVLYSNNELKNHVIQAIKARKRGQKLPQTIGMRRYTLGGEIDFGSFRDLQRHRNGVCLMPTLSPWTELNEWYAKKLPKEIVGRMSELQEQLQKLSSDHTVSAVMLQYAVPMGMNVPIHYECDLNQLIYLMELRSGKTVHQTLRHYMHRVITEFKTANKFDTLVEPGQGLFVDMDVENFTLKRGTQTFGVPEGHAVHAAALRHSA